MKEIKSNISGTTIWYSENPGDFQKLLPTKRIIVISDKQVSSIYSSHFKNFESLIIGRGEAIKTFDTVQFLVSELVRLRVDRDCFILGIGGGIVCDITGFVASIFMRGLPFAFVPTTLLAQVDAAIGGKNGVNFDAYKNMAGVFAQPEFTFVCPAYLSSLNAEEYRNGLAETLKHALISDSELFKFMEKQHKKILSLNPEILEILLSKSIEIKAGIVAQDEREGGIRRILNFGHTFGHAIEKESGISHGKAVSLGMLIAAKLSVSKGFLQEIDFQKTTNILELFGLPVSFSINSKNLLKWIEGDKKKAGTAIRFIFLKEIGKAEAIPVTLNELQQIKEFKFLK